jgi:hypothetical protein
MKNQLERLWFILTCKEMIQLSRLQERHETMEKLNKMKRLNESGKHTYNTRHIIMSEKRKASAEENQYSMDHGIN